MKTKILTLALLLVGLIVNAQQLENIEGKSAKTVNQNKDKIAEAAANIAEEVNNAVENDTAIIDDITARDIDKVVQELENSLSDNTIRSDEPLPSILGTITQELSGQVPSPKVLEPSHKPAEESSSVPSLASSSEANPDDTDNVVVTSNEVQADERTKTIIFRGNVIIEIKGSELKCDNLVIQLNEQDDPQIITATGGIVQFKQVAIENGKRILRLATSHKVVHVVDTEVTTLSGGPPMLKNGDQLVTTESNSAIITMDRRAQRFSVSGPNRTSDNCNRPTSATGRSTIRMPIRNIKNWDKKYSTDKNLR